MDTNTENNLDRQIQQFFDSKKLAGDRLIKLRAVAERAEAPSAKFGHTRVAMAAALAIASSIGIVVGHVIATQGSTTSEPTNFVTVGNVQAPSIVALRFHADWCLPSQEMAPRCERLVREFGREHVLFVDLDLTDNVTSTQAQNLAASLGVLDMWRDAGSQSGEVLVVDRLTGQAIHRLTSEDDYTSMRAVLAEAMAAVALTTPVAN